ncbi:MAG TPA: sulfatase [Verrucomicrobia bacterium]|nr:sulfatase [Verrucomicrobiota bacterium]
MRPNILYLHSHDTGRYIQPHGHAVPTPALQRLAEDGVLFRQNFCVNPTCSPSRAALLTGCYPHENGMTGLAHRGFTLNDYGQHLLHTLRNAGYISALAGVQHIASRTASKLPWEIIGYDRWLGHEARDGAVEFIENCTDAPFFLSVGFNETHREFPVLDASPDDPRYCLVPAPLPDTPQTRVDMARYKASARILDRKIGDVLDALDRCGKAENTLVICTTDHGIAFPHMKCNLTDHGIGVMLMMRGPGGFSGGKVVDAMTSHLDVFPTICDLLDVEPPSWLRGKSLLPLVNACATAIHDELFFEVNYHAAYEPMRAVRTGRWKYIRRFDGRQTPVLVNCDAGESKALWLAQDWPERAVAEEQLFDLCFDPNEVCNQASDPGCNAILREMRNRLERWMHATNDPLLSGSLLAPVGAKLNAPNDVSLK